MFLDTLIIFKRREKKGSDVEPATSLTNFTYFSSNTKVIYYWFFGNKLE